MKLVFWIIGAPASGKTHEAQKMGERLDLPVYHLDLIDDRVEIDRLTKEDGYRDILKDLPDQIIIEGLIPFTFNRDLRIVKEILKDYKIIFLFLEPEYQRYKEQVLLRQNSHLPGEPQYPKLMSEEEYRDYNKNFKNNIGIYLALENGTEDITDEDMRSFNYQHDGFTDVKFKQLKIKAKGKTILDLGCSSCAFEKYLMEDGALKYTGLDVNKIYLANENARLFDINNLENWLNPADIVICSSVLHYIHDKEKLIREASRLANELFVLETPLHPGDQKELVLGSRGLYFPTESLLEEWIFKYFKSFKCLGKSIVEDGSYRLIYHCFK